MTLSTHGDRLHFNTIKLLLEAVFNNSFGLVFNLKTLPKALSSYTYSMNPCQLSNNEPEHKRLFKLNAQTRLLSLPRELRDAIYHRVLRSRDIINFAGPSDFHRPIGLRKKIKKPALLHVSSQIRAEASPIYDEVSPSLQGEISVDSFPRVVKWAARLLADELRDISRLTIHFRLEASHVENGIDERYVMALTGCYLL
jgi:hypothetical protein